MADNTGKGISLQNRRLPEPPTTDNEELNNYIEELNRFLQTYIWDKDFGAPQSIPNSQLIDNSIELSKIVDGTPGEYLGYDVDGHLSEVPTPTDELVAASLTDTDPGTLSEKIVSGEGVDISLNNSGGNETLTISSTSGLPINVRNFKIQNNSTDSINDIDFVKTNIDLRTTLVTRDSSNIERVKTLVGTGLTKRLDASWASGDNQGGRASGVSLTANTTYYCFALFNSDGSVEDYGFDTSKTADNLLADAAVVAAGITEYTYVAAIKTNGSSGILNGFWRETLYGSLEFFHDSKVVEFSGSVLTDTGRTSKAVAAPIGVRPIFEFFAETTTSSREVFVDLYDNSLPNPLTVFANCNYTTGFAAQIVSKFFVVDSSGNIDYNFRQTSGFNGALVWRTVGWEDIR